jgi:hypothetical protein
MVLAVVAAPGFQHGHRRRTDAKQFRVRLVDADLHREALRYMHPVKRALNARQSAGQCKAGFIGRDTIADRVDAALETLARIAHQVDRDRRPRPDALEFGLAKIRDHVPVARIDQGEDRFERRGKLAGRCLQ